LIVSYIELYNLRSMLILRFVLWK